MTRVHLPRRTFMAFAAATLLPGRALANLFREITWQDLIPEGVWVSGRVSAKAMSTQIADVGYQIAAEKIEVYQWQ